MNNYQTTRTPSTALNLGFMATLLISSSAIAAADIGPQPQKDLLHGSGVRLYRDASFSSTFASTNPFAKAQTRAVENVESIVSAFYTQLSSRQVTLDDDIETVLFENLWDLYSE